MFLLSPTKLLTIMVVALIVLGPDKLPKVASQIGALWADLRRWRTQLERQVQGIFPDLPGGHDLVQAVRSPLTYLDRLADEHPVSGVPPGVPGIAIPGHSGSDCHESEGVSGG